jgi:hypothetical protein
MWHDLWMTKYCVALLLLAAGCLTMADAQTRSSTTHVEQTQFSAEDDAVQSPVRIPDDAWAIITSDRNTKIYQDDGVTPAEPKRSWFSAAVVHLQNSARNDLLIAAEGPLSGGNIETFWIFLDTPNGMRLVLTAGAHDLIIHNTRRNGYRTIELDSVTCCRISTTMLRYERGEYREYRNVAKNIQ